MSGAVSKDSKRTSNGLEHPGGGRAIIRVLPFLFFPFFCCGDQGGTWAVDCGLAKAKLIIYYAMHQTVNKYIYNI